MTSDQLLEWVKDRASYLKMDRIARELDIPGRTLRAWADGNRPLPEKYQEKVQAWAKEFLSLPLS